MPSLFNKHLIILFVLAVAFTVMASAAMTCGDSCTKDEDCQGKLACVSSQCGDDPYLETEICSPSKLSKGCSNPCQADDDCPGRLACMNSVCADDPAMGTHICSSKRDHPPKAAPAPKDE